MGRTAIVDTMQDAIDFSKKTGSGVRFVTLEGEVVNASGAITGGKYKNATANLLEKRRDRKTGLKSDMRKNLRQHGSSGKNRSDSAHLKRLSAGLKNDSGSCSKAVIVKSDCRDSCRRHCRQQYKAGAAAGFHRFRLRQRREDGL
ncbi:MAG: hypothetical protein ACLTK0_10665 [Anaerovoracaceae bacterium]